MKRYRLLPLLCLLLSSATLAQTAGRVSGTVRDATDARIPGAKVIVTEEETTIERSAQANADGNYVVSHLEPGTYPGPGLQLWDVSLRKRFVLREQWRRQFHGDFFNAFNKANFTGLNVNVSNAEFGSVTTAAPGRNIQLGLKLTF